VRLGASHRCAVTPAKRRHPDDPHRRGVGRGKRGQSTMNALAGGQRPGCIGAGLAGQDLAEVIKRLTEHGEYGLGSVADQWQWCCGEQEHGHRERHATADQCVEQPLRSGAGAVQGDDQDRRGGRLIDEHRSRPDEVVTDHRRQTHRHQHSHPQGDRTHSRDGLHTDTDDDPQCDPGDQL